MKKKKRINLNLTDKKAKKISIIISVIFSISFLILGIASENLEEAKIEELVIFIVVMLLVTPILTFLFSYEMISTQRRISEIEKYEEIKESIYKFLNKDEFREIYFVHKKNNEEDELIADSIIKEDCKFFAKLSEKDAIIIILKNNNDEIIWENIISSYLYFDKYFKLLKR